MGGQCDTVEGNGPQGMSQVLPANGFNNMVNTAILRQRVNLVSPVPFKPVDAPIGTERFSQRQFFITARRHKNFCTVCFGDLQREDCDTTSALHQHRLSGT